MYNIPKQLITNQELEGIELKDLSSDITPEPRATT